MRANRRRLAIIAAVAAAVVALAFAVPWLYANVIADDAPDAFALDNAEDPAGEPINPEGTWTVSDGSEAGYRVDEILNGQDVTVVGRTPDVSGQVTVADGDLTEAAVVVDMTTVTTDSSARDGQFATSILLTDRYPEATFSLSDPVDVAALAEGGAVDVSAPGTLTLRDTTLDVTAEVQARGVDTTVEVVGSIPITFTDFGIDAPDLGFVKVEDSGLVEFRLVLDRE